MTPILIAFAIAAVLVAALAWFAGHVDALLDASQCRHVGCPVCTRARWRQ